jgi:hypothetical protein
MAPADQAEDYQISKRVVREIHRGPVWASRSPIDMWDGESCGMGAVLANLLLQ